MGLSLKSLLVSSLIGVVGVTATLAVSASQNSVQQKPKTFQEFVKTHPNLTVEYRYPSMGKKLHIAQSGNKVKLPAGSPVVLRVTETINSSSVTQGASLTFTVVQDVKVNDAVVIKAGTTAEAQVSVNESAGRIGDAGKVVVSDFSTRGVDGSFIPLRGTISGQGKDKTVTSGVLSWLICPLFLLMKGQEAVIPAGTEKTTYTASDVEVTVQQN